MKKILVTGATGYIGGRLVTRLVEAGYPVRCLVRDPERLQGYAWLDKVEVVQGDALDQESLVRAMQGISTAYYLIHGVRGGKVDAERDMQMARNFASASEQARIEHIIYLGELVQTTANLSPYLRSRHETGYILRQGPVPVTEFRAGLIVGSGGALFEMIRYLTEREPVLICPRWFFTMAQPISIADVLDYLVAAIETPEARGRLIKIGGATQLTYADMLLGYAKIRGLKRLLIPTPVYAPRLSAYWVHMVTPVHWRAVLPLIEGMNVESTVDDDCAKSTFPDIHPLDYETAVRASLGRVLTDQVETSWADALVTSTSEVKPVKLIQKAGMMIERRQLVVDLPPEPVFQSFASLGGQMGWLYMNWAWAIRGWFDKLVGGVGLRRGRRHSTTLRVGESLDFWRVEEIEKNALLRLRAEMKVPGKAWLQFETIPDGDGQTLLTQTAYFAPKGLFGFLYWYSLYPIHALIFKGMIRRIAERARQMKV